MKNLSLVITLTTLLFNFSFADDNESSWGKSIVTTPNPNLFYECVEDMTVWFDVTNKAPFIGLYYYIEYSFII